MDPGQSPGWIEPVLTRAIDEEVVPIWVQQSRLAPQVGLGEEAAVGGFGCSALGGVGTGGDSGARGTSGGGDTDAGALRRD